MRRAVAFLLVLTCGDARAEGPWGIAFGAGPALHLADGYGPTFDVTFGASAKLDAGYRFVGSAAVGAHVGLAYMQRSELPGENEPTAFPFEVGVGAQFVIADRVLIAPWAGVLDVGGRRPLAGGAALAYDLLVRGRDRISAVATFLWAHQPHDSIVYTSIGAGVAYRYW